MQFLAFESLHDTLEKNVKRLTLQLDIQQLNRERIASIGAMIKSHKGDKTLMVDVFDNTEKIKLTLPSRKQKVAVSKDLLDELEEQALPYKLN